MIPSAFAYETPSTVEEAVALLAEHGDEAKILAGGHSLIPLMKLRLAVPEVLIDIGNIEGLSGISTDKRSGQGWGRHHAQHPGGLGDVGYGVPAAPADGCHHRRPPSA